METPKIEKISSGDTKQYLTINKKNIYLIIIILMTFIDT